MAKRFTKPNIEELQAYAKSLHYDKFDAQYFFDFYEVRGWRIGRPPGTPIKDWKALVRIWLYNSQDSRKTTKVSSQSARG